MLSMKAISPIIAILTLTTITIVMTMGTYIFLGKTTISSSNFSSSQSEKVTIGMGTSLRIEEINNDTIYIRNTGSRILDTKSIAVYIDNNLVRINLSQSDNKTEPGDSGMIKLETPMAAGNHTIHVEVGSGESGDARKVSIGVIFSNASVSGYVRDISGNGIAGASVSCGLYSTITAANGYYEIKNINMSSTISSCAMTASKSPTFNPSSIVVTLKSGSIVSQNFQLSYANTNIFGYVTTISGSGIPGASVVCGGYSTTTTSDGSYSINVVATSSTFSCTITASKTPTFIQGSALITVNTGSSTRKDLQLSYANASIFGHIYVRNISNGGIPEATVVCSDYSTTTASDGSYSINLPMSASTSSCSMSVSKTNYPHVISSTISLSAGTTTIKDIELPFECSLYDSAPYGEYCLWAHYIYCPYKPPGGYYCAYEERGWGYKNITFPPNYREVLLTKAAFDDNGIIYANGIEVYRDPTWENCHAQEFNPNPPVNLTPFVHPGTNLFSAYNEDLYCAVSSGSWVWIIFK